MGFLTEANSAVSLNRSKVDSLIYKRAKKTKRLRLKDERISNVTVHIQKSIPLRWLVIKKTVEKVRLTI